MSFRTNTNQQLSMFDSTVNLTEREQRVLGKSWAKTFAEDIFCAIDEERFAVLYSKTASRPNTPVNVIVGALIIKELFDLSDDEIVENLMLDIHYQYALHTTSFTEQPLSDKSLSRFRKRCYEYEKETGIDLFHNCVRDLNDKIAKLMGINSHIRRMDSLMIESNIRNLSRIELLYTCVARFVQYLSKNNADIDISGMEHYCQPDDRNYVIYHCRNIDASDRMSTILADADSLLSQCYVGFEDIEEYKMLVRCIDEQTVIEDNKRRLRNKKSESPKPESLQNPTDPDATFRTKAGKSHIGYVANIVETVSNHGTVITDYQYEKNTYSDSHFLSDHIEREENQEERLHIVVDGAYSGQDLRDKAEKKNIEIINTSLNGMPVPDIYADFILSKDGEKVIKCAADHAPIRCTYVSTSKQIKVYFLSECCKNCPHKSECHAEIRNKTSKMVISRSAAEKAKQLRIMNTEEFKNWHRIRNGVEAIPSILRNHYHVDSIPVRGRIESKLFFGAKIMAINFSKLLRQKRGLYCCTQNPLLT